MKIVWGGVITLLAAALFASCGITKVDSIHPMVQTASFGEEKKIVILPFADYTPFDSSMGYWRRNVLIMESLQDEILRYGYMPVVNEDVISYLTDKKIINQEKMTRKPSSAGSMLKAELAKEWSDEMKVEIATVLLSNAKKRKAESIRDMASEYKTIALDAGVIRDIGRTFDADYIVRGRIMVFKTGREDSFNPLQTGVLPFFFNFGSGTAFGIAESENYEMIDKMAIGGLLGAAIAPSGWPIEESSADTVLSDAHPRFDGGLSAISGTSYAEWNTAIWGVAGSAVTHLAHKGGRVENAVVQLRMVVQDTRTGGILWTNRSEVKTMSEGVFSKKDADTLMSHAIQQLCERLVDSFAATENNRRIVRINDDGTLYVTPLR
ncbi:hypothetical protein [Desulfobacter postgatei]|uniref:hypothetical protein n=1 Tax=Desulfobacter postgatei TaxID=2293 RepID=UPI00259BC350|nr:hypothetical protein [uncultured Desulfobacter sp.]